MSATLMNGISMNGIIMWQAPHLMTRQNSSPKDRILSLTRIGELLCGCGVGTEFGCLFTVLALQNQDHLRGRKGEAGKALAESIRGRYLEAGVRNGGEPEAFISRLALTTR